MLVEQAALSFKIWFNNAPKTTYIKELIDNERL
jgi:shikimate 5-dehydrogenase